VNPFGNRRRHWPLQIASVTIMVLVLVMMNLLTLAANLFDRAVTETGRGLEMIVYLRDGAGEADVARVEKMARAGGDFTSVTSVDAARATRQFLASLGRESLALLDDPEWKSPIPPTLELRLSDQVAPEARVGTLRAWSGRFHATGVVADVFYGQGWVENFSRFIGGARTLFAGLWLLASAVGLLIVGNCIRLSFQQRRDEIEILELLGATPRFIRRPFMAEGLALGAVASALSLALSWGLHAAVLHWLAGAGASYVTVGTVAPLPWWCVALNVASASSFGALGAWDCVRRLNTGWSAAA